MKHNTDLYSLYIRAINTGTPDKAKTLKAFQRRAIITREALKLASEQYQADLKELGETYKQKALEERRKPLDDEYKAIVKLAKERCLDDLESVLEGKRKQFDRSNDAPTEEQVRLLTVLGMRSDLTAAEVANVAEKLNDNIPACRLLRDIAKRHGIPFPDVGNADIFTEAMEAAEDYAKQMIDGMDNVDDKALSYRQLCFWKYPDEPTEADRYFARLDNNVLSAPQETEAPAIPAGKRPNAVRVFLRGDENLGGIAMQFGINSSEIRSANPNTDFSRLTHGTSIIVPAGTLKVTNEPGSIIPGQCTPAYFEPPTSETGSYVKIE